MAAGDKRLGLDGKFYWGAAGVQASILTNNVREVTLNMNPRTAKTLMRGKHWVSSKAVAFEASLEFEALDIEADGFLAALKTAHFNRTRIALYPRDATGGDGLDADYYITGFSRGESNEEYIAYSVTAEPTDEERDPQWV